MMTRGDISRRAGRPPPQRAIPGHRRAASRLHMSTGRRNVPCQAPRQARVEWMSDSLRDRLLAVLPFSTGRRSPRAKDYYHARHFKLSAIEMPYRSRLRAIPCEMRGHAHAAAPTKAGHEPRRRASLDMMLGAMMSAAAGRRRFGYRGLCVVRSCVRVNMPSRRY